MFILLPAQTCSISFARGSSDGASGCRPTAAACFSLLECRILLGKNLLLDLQRKLYIIKVRWQVKKGR